MLAHDLGAFRGIIIERLALSRDLVLLPRVEIGRGDGAGVAPRRHECAAEDGGAFVSWGKRSNHHSVIDWMNFLVIWSSILRCAMSTFLNVSTSRMFSLRSSIIWSKTSDCICNCS